MCSARQWQITCRLLCEAVKQGPLGARTAAQVLSAVNKPGVSVGGQPRRIALVDRKYDAGLAASLPCRQFSGRRHSRCRSELAQSRTLAPAVNEEAPQKPRGIVIGPAREPGSSCLERQHANRCSAGLNDIRPPGLVREAGQRHAQRIAHKVELPRCQLEEGHCTELDGARVRSQVVEGNEPDGLAGAVQLAGVSVSPDGELSAGGPAGSIHMTSQRWPSGSWKLWLYINP
jgi:hypothetical protein